nr:hypothetical protein [Tanacetum cinerariifolium]
MLKQRKEKCIEREQADKLTVQKEQEEQTAQSFTPYWNSPMIDDEEVLLAREKLMKAIQTFLQKLSHYPFEVMPKELSDYTNSSSWNRPIFYNNDEHSREYLKKSSKAITPVLPTEEPGYSLSMGDEHLSTISKTESDELIKSSVENLVPILSESEVTSDNESECDVPVKDESSLIFTIFSNPLFDCNDDFSSSDDKSLSNEDVLMENFKIYSNPLFDDEEIISNKIDPHYFNSESNLIESLPNRDTLFDSSPKFDYLEEFSVNTIIETLPTSPIPVEDSDSLREEIDIFTGTDDLMPPGIKNDDYDSEEDIYFLEELFSNDSILLLENESSDFDHHDELSFPLPLPEPLDVEVFFNFEPDLGELISAVINNIDELIEDECFDQGEGVKTPFLTLASPLRADGISSGWNFHVL